jgi:hypothetical protein
MYNQVNTNRVSNRSRLLSAVFENCSNIIWIAGAFVAFSTAFLITSDAAKAYEIYSGNGIQISLDTTAEYNTDLRVNRPSATILAEPNHDDGDRNLSHGFVANQFEVLPVLSIGGGNFGIHISGEAYIDPTYLSSNQNTSPATVNYFGNPKNFPRGTENIDGRNAELLDAFAFDSFNFGATGDQSVTLKVGRSTLLWGQSLFFTNNGIAAGQAPIDVNKALSLANPQAQQVFLPVGQAILSYQPTDWLTLQGYYQFQWTPDQLPGAGSYFSGTDFVGEGAQRIIAAVTPSGPVYLSRAQDISPPQENGQFGMSAQLQLNNYDIGFYGLRYDSKSPQFYIHETAPSPTSSGLNAGTFNTVFQREIQIYGASLSTTVGPVNVAGEVSTRRHMDLYSNLIPYEAGFNENSNPGYAVGNTLQEQASAIYVTPGLPLMPGGATVLGEVEANHVLKVTNNKDALIPDRSPNAVGLQVEIIPEYYNVLPQLNITFPIGLTWYPTGDSQIDSSMNAGTGVLDIGVTGTFKTVWIAGLTYQDYLGSTSVISDTGSKQKLADRGFVSLFIQHTF